MDSLLLQPMAYAPPQEPSLDRRLTIIEDEPQDTDSYLPWSPQKFDRLSTVIESPTSSRGAPTPTAFHFTLDTQQHYQQFDDLYDMTDNEAEDIPITISVEPEVQEMRPSRRRYPSLIIPSPSKWPTPPVGKPQKKGFSPAPILSPGMLSPHGILSPSIESLAKLASHNAAQRPSSSNTPSLDGSLTSEELSTMSCPSTPDLGRGEQKEEDWSAPVQLHPEALETLECLTGVTQDSESQVFAIPIAEMQEVPEAQVEEQFDLLITPVETDDGTMSFLSIPSPGGFFSTLEPSSRHTWAPSPSEPSTSIAERFYGVPWRNSTTDQTVHSQTKPPSPRGRPFPQAKRSPPIVERNIFVHDDENLTEGPPTARRIPLASPKGSVTGTVQTPRTAMFRAASPPAETIPEETEYNEGYISELNAKGAVSLDRTTHWLEEQTSYLAQMIDDKPTEGPRQRSSSGSESVASPGAASTNGSSHKSVRFAETTEPSSPESKPTSPKEKDSTFVRGFQHLNENSQESDAFIHRKTRTDALRLDRNCLFSSHVNQLESKYELPESQRIAPMRPVSHLNIEVEENTEEKKMLANAQKERKALDQIKSVSWNLEATKYLNGGGLLMSPTGKTFKKTRKGRVLDLGGQATCDWAWQVAIEHPSVVVHTVYTPQQQNVDKTIEGPENHKQQPVPNLWTLPYPNNHFHLVSARNLYQHLKTYMPSGSPADEYDLCLREALRVLKPGGCLEFSLLDADILNPGPLAQALGVEFCYNLKHRGYDPAPTKTWLPRLRKAGFGEVRRAWLVLPMTQTGDEAAQEGEGNTMDASYVTGMVGSWAWERWMLKLHREMGWPEDRLLEGVQAALEEGARSGSSWRYLSGWARKPKY
jgi:SAM-dependent methyltransferase